MNDAYHSSAHSHANYQTQKHPRMPDVTCTSDPSKRPRTTSYKLCTNIFCNSRQGHSFTECMSYGGGHMLAQAAGTNDPKQTRTDDSIGGPGPLSRSDTSRRISTADDEAHARNVMSNASNTHLGDRDNNTVLGQIQSYQQVSNESCYYVATANRHIFCDKSAFETYENIFLPTKVCATGLCLNALYAIGRGTVRVECRYGGEVTTIRLCDVLHVPCAPACSNIISGVQLDKAGVTVKLGDGLVILSLRGTDIVEGKICDDLYRLEMSVIRPSNAESRSKPPSATGVYNLYLPQPINGLFREGFYIV